MTLCHFDFSFIKFLVTFQQFMITQSAFWPFVQLIWSLHTNKLKMKNNMINLKMISFKKKEARSFDIHFSATLFWNQWFPLLYAWIGILVIFSKLCGNEKHSNINFTDYWNTGNQSGQVHLIVSGHMSPIFLFISQPTSLKSEPGSR